MSKFSSGASSAGFEKFDEKFTSTSFLETEPPLSDLPRATVFGSGAIPITWVPGEDQVYVSESGSLGTAKCAADDKKGSYISAVTNGAGEVLPISPQDPFYVGTGTSPGARHRAQRDVLAPQQYTAAFSDWNVSGDLKLSYEVTEDVLGYASYARSFKTGGITLNGVPTDPTTGAPLIGS